MGLDTTHDCWHGPYSAFMRWRAYLHQLIQHREVRTRRAATDWWGVEKRKLTVVNPGKEVEMRNALLAAWERGDYNDQTVPINVLMRHSDCDGSISTKVCGPLADALEELLPLMPEIEERTYGTDPRSCTLRFITGLRLAAERGEDVKFH